MLYEGKCLCGGCKIFVDSEPLLKGLVLCHCTDCSRSTGGAFACGAPVPRDSVKTEGSVKLYAFVHPSNGNTVSRWFCADCGAHLFSQSSAHPDRTFVRAGVIDGFTKMAIVLEVFAKDRWPSVPPIPGAVQVEDGQAAKSINEETKLLLLRTDPQATKNAPDTKQDL
ncbi:Mss4-like protein [Amanita rubescens]|nr:Mss4-like protein [Amanita rubescens]